jgi:exodeoxyribonuclease VIII
MKLGLFPNMPEAEYRAIPAANATALKAGRRSIAHMRWTMQNPKAPTPAMELGTAVHMALLEPQRFKDTYAACPEDCTRASKVWKDHVAFCDKSGMTPITYGDYHDLLAMCRGVIANPDADAMLKQAGQCEYVAVWQDPGTGLACKARLDKYLPGALALDIKTTRNASREVFSRDCYTLGYWQQIAWYREGFKRASGEDTPFTIIAIENEAPHLCAVYSLGDESLARGVAENHRILKQYAKALESGTFPGYAAGVQEIDIPAWAMKEHPPEAMEWDSNDNGGF